jgi:hypothetical protein
MNKRQKVQKLTEFPKKSLIWQAQDASVVLGEIRQRADQPIGQVMAYRFVVVEKVRVLRPVHAIFQFLLVGPVAYGLVFCHSLHVKLAHL